MDALRRTSEDGESKRAPSALFPTRSLSVTSDSFLGGRPFSSLLAPAGAAAQPQELRRTSSSGLLEVLPTQAGEEDESEVEVCFRMSRARQTVEWVSRARRRHDAPPSSPRRLSVLQALRGLRDCPSVSTRLILGAQGPPVRHLGPALLLASRLRAQHPQQPWFALVGLLHSLGRLLLHPALGASPTWEVVGETFPVGCRFDPRIAGSQFFAANPDRRKRDYSTSTGVYAPGCGLMEVDMCWSGDEYTTGCLLRANSPLPAAALFCLRYSSFATLGGGAYSELMNEEDRECLPWLERLREAKAAVYSPASRDEAAWAEEHAELLLPQYQELVHAYCPGADFI